MDWRSKGRMDGGRLKLEWSKDQRKEKGRNEEERRKEDKKKRSRDWLMAEWKKVFEEEMKKKLWLSEINVALVIDHFTVLPYFIVLLILWADWLFDNNNLTKQWVIGLTQKFTLFYSEHWQQIETLRRQRHLTPADAKRTELQLQFKHVPFFPFLWNLIPYDNTQWVWHHTEMISLKHSAPKVFKMWR